MASKIIPLSARKKQPQLSPLMIAALVEAYVKQSREIPFGPGDIKGSFSSLINRGLIVRKKVSLQNGTETLWQLTPEAIEIIKDLGVEVSG